MNNERLSKVESMIHLQTHDSNLIIKCELLCYSLFKHTFYVLLATIYKKSEHSDDPLVRIKKRGHALSIDPGPRNTLWVVFDHSAVDGIMFLDQFVVSEDVFR